MAEVKAEAPFLQQLLDEVTPSVDFSEGLIGITENINMEEVYDNGYIFIFDKDSSCGQRSFWRCERKNECPARVHTNPLTNQIIKRIHQHSHEPPNPDELPPWLHYNKNDDRGTSPHGDYTQKSSSPGTCLLLPRPVPPGASTTQNLSQFINQTKENVVSAEREEETLETSRKRSRKLKDREPPTDVVSVKQLFLQHPTEFWELFEATRKMVEFLKGDESFSSSCVTSTDTEYGSAVSRFLDSIEMRKYRTLFAKFSLDVMKSLNTEELTRLCGNEADALCIYHSLKIRSSTSHASSTAIKVFVGKLPSQFDDEPMFQMVVLKNRTKEEFITFLEKKRMIDTSVVERYCVPGPGGIKVELSDEIVASWKNDSVFQIIICKDVCKLEPAALRRNGKNCGNSDC